MISYVGFLEEHFLYLLINCFGEGLHVLKLKYLEFAKFESKDIERLLI